MKTPLLFAALALIPCFPAPVRAAEGEKKISNKESAWEGIWQSDGKDAHGGELTCQARPVDGEKWQATFTGYCNHQFVYEIEMSGVREGKKITFSGEADLGDEDGKYTWSGEIAGGEFSGKYRSETGKTGHFKMKKAKPGSTPGPRDEGARSGADRKKKAPAP